MALVKTTEMFKKAFEGKYSIGAFNINIMEIIQGILRGAAALNSAVILQCSKSALKYAGPKCMHDMVAAIAEETGVDVALHLDHGPDLETVKLCVENGFTSVMFDGSHYDYEENVAKTKEVVDYAHAHGVVVEAELGKLAGVEDEVSVAEGHATYTDPDQALDFVQRTGVDSLAVAIGTSHGAYKFKPGQKPQLRFDILAEVAEKLPGFPIVLHGASSVMPEYVKMINEFGGEMPDAIGIPEEMLRKAASMAVCKINVDSDIRLAMTASIRKHFAEYPSHFDPRQYLTDARNAIESIVEHKINTVLGCAGQA